MSACRDYLDLLSASLDGALAPSEAEALDRHLARCPACREALEGLRATVAQIRALDPVEPPPGFAEAILARVGRPSPWRRRILSLVKRPQIQAAALLLVCFTGYLVARLKTTSPLVLPGTPAAPRELEEAAPAEPPASARSLPPAPHQAPVPRAPLGSTPAPAWAPAPGAGALGAGAAPGVGRPAEPGTARDSMPAPAAEADRTAAPTTAERAGPSHRGEEASRTMAKKAAHAEITVNFHLEAEVPGEAEGTVLEALHRQGAILLAQGDRRAVARMDGQRLPALRADLDKAGRISGSLPADLPSEVVVTISW